MSTDKPLALALADSAHLGYRVGWQKQAQSELRRLHARVQELEAATDPGKRCPCGYPMPCAINVPIGFCRNGGAA